jgi:hypothetical protein
MCASNFQSFKFRLPGEYQFPENVKLGALLAKCPKKGRDIAVADFVFDVAYHKANYPETYGHLLTTCRMEQLAVVFAAHPEFFPTAEMQLILYSMIEAGTLATLINRDKKNQSNISSLVRLSAACVAKGGTYAGALLELGPEYSIIP